MKRLATALVAIAVAGGLLASHAHGTSKTLSYPSTTAGCTSSDSIKSCWDAAGAGGTVVIKPGTYTTSSIAVAELDHSGTLQGSCGKTFLDGKDSSDGVVVEADDITIKCLTIEHTGSGADGISASRANIHISNVTFLDDRTGVTTSGGVSGSGLQVTGSTFTGIGADAIHVQQDTDAVTISGNTFHNAWGDCIDATALSDSTVTRNAMVACYDDAIYIGSGQSTQVTNNTITNADGAGIHIGDGAVARSFTIQGNTITGAAGYGILAGASAFHADETVVKSNTIASSAGGIYVYGGNPDIEGNKVSYATAGDGIAVVCSTCDGMKIQSNTAVGSADGCAGFRITLNVSAAPGTNGGPGGTVGKNTATNNQCYGFYVEGGSSSHYGGLTLTGNTATGNGVGARAAYGGFVVDWSDGDTLSGNIAASNAGEGFYLNRGAGDTLTGNTAKGNTLDGFEVAELTTGATLSKNAASANIGDGFNVDDHDTVLTGNSASGSRGQDCTYDASEDGGTPLANSVATDKCADKSNFTVPSELTDE